MLQVDENYDGREVSLRSSETIELRLKENRTTGFGWTFKSKGEPVCTLVDESFSSGGRSLGSGGTHTWHLRVVGSGTAIVELVYARRWQQEQPPARTFKFTVRAGG